MWVFSSLMFSQNYRLFLNIFKVKLLQKLKALGRIFLSFYTELGKQWVKCMQFSCSKISHFLTTTAEVFFLLGTIRFFFVRNFDATLCSYKPWDGGWEEAERNNEKTNSCHFKYKGFAPLYTQNYFCSWVQLVTCQPVWMSNIHRKNNSRKMVFAG